MKILFCFFLLNFSIFVWCSKNTYPPKQNVLSKSLRTSSEVARLAECKINVLKLSLLSKNNTFKVQSTNYKEKTKNWTKFTYTIQNEEKQKTIKVCVPNEKNKIAWVSQYCINDLCEYGNSRKCRK
jgi:hypothetical protein